MIGRSFITAAFAFALMTGLVASSAQAQDMRNTPPRTIFDWDDRVSVTLRDQGRASIAAGQPQRRMVAAGRTTPATEAEDDRKQGIEFGGNINVGIAIPF